MRQNVASRETKTTITLQKLNHQSWTSSRVHHLPSKNKHHLLVIHWKMKRADTKNWTRTCPVISYHHRWTTRRSRNDCFFSTPEETGIITLDGYRWWISNEDLLFFNKKLAEQKPFQQTIPAILSNLQCVGSRISFTLKGQGIWENDSNFVAHLGPKENVKKHVSLRFLGK